MMREEIRIGDKKKEYKTKREEKEEENEESIQSKEKEKREGWNEHDKATKMDKERGSFDGLSGV